MGFFKRLQNAAVTTTVSAAPPPRSGWLACAKAAKQGGVMLAAQATGAGLSVIVAPLVTFTGRLYIAVVVGLQRGWLMHRLRVGAARLQR